MGEAKTYFHIHLISDSTGETLLTVARAVAARYEDLVSIEHVYPLVRSARHLDRVLADIDEAPGIVLHTLVDRALSARVVAACKAAGVPAVAVLDPVVAAFDSFLHMPASMKVGGQHALDADYFSRIDALDYTMAHDDGQLPADLESADVVILGVSRTSKTPTAMYLAIRGLKVVNVPLVPGVALPEAITRAKRPLVVGLIASAESILQVRQNRLIAMGTGDGATAYVDRAAITREVAQARRVYAENGWPTIDVTRRSIEETATAILALLNQHRYGREPRPERGSDRGPE